MINIPPKIDLTNHPALEYIFTEEYYSKLVLLGDSRITDKPSFSQDNLVYVLKKPESTSFDMLYDTGITRPEHIATVTTIDS